MNISEYVDMQKWNELTAILSHPGMYLLMLVSIMLLAFGLAVSSHGWFGRLMGTAGCILCGRILVNTVLGI